MAANTTIQLKKSATPSAVPAANSLAFGEIAINYADGKLYYRNVANQIVEFKPSDSGMYFGTVDANGTLLLADTTNDVLSIVPGTGISIVGDAINDKITISATGGGGGGGGASVTVDSSAPGSPSNGDLWYNTNIGKLLLYYNDGDSSQWVEVTSNYITSNTPTPSVGSLAWKSASIEYPETFNKIPLFFTANAITVQKVIPTVIGTGTPEPSVTFSVRYGTNPNDTGTEIKVGGININASNVGNTGFTTFDNASIPANNYIWAYVSYATTSTDWLNLTIGF